LKLLEHEIGRVKKNHPDDNFEVVEEAESGTREFDELRLFMRRRYEAGNTLSLSCWSLSIWHEGS